MKSKGPALVAYFVLSQEGQCLIYGAQAKAARDAVNELVGDVEIGEVYGGVVLEQRDFGVVIEIMRNKEALLHVSELTDDPDVLAPRGQRWRSEILFGLHRREIDIDID